MTPPYAVIFTPAPFMQGPNQAKLAKLTTTGNGQLSYYKPVLSGRLREVAEVAEKLNAAAVPTEPISEITP